jgi:hypothetical protein
MNRLGAGIIISSIASVGCILLFLILTYLYMFGSFGFGLTGSRGWVALVLFTAIMFFGAMAFGAMLFVDSNKRNWDISLQKNLFQRVLFATFPIGNLIYYSKVLARDYKKRPIPKAKRISYTKGLFLSALVWGTILLIIGTLVGFTATLFSPILFDPFPARMLSLAKLSFGLLIATTVFWECFHVMMVLDLTERALTTPDKIPANLRYFPDPFRPGRGTFAYYFKFLRKEPGLKHSTRLGELNQSKE